MTSDFDKATPRSLPAPPAGRTADSAGRAENSVTDRVAVALRYAPTDAESAPQVVASGRGWIAEKILELAFANDIRVREDADLVEVLSALEIGDEIPLEAFIAVAEILRYVYAANNAAPPEVPPC